MLCTHFWQFFRVLFRLCGARVFSPIWSGYFAILPSPRLLFFIMASNDAIKFTTFNILSEISFDATIDSRHSKACGVVLIHLHILLDFIVFISIEHFHDCQELWKVLDYILVLFSPVLFQLCLFRFNAIVKYSDLYCLSVSAMLFFALRPVFFVNRLNSNLKKKYRILMLVYPILFSLSLLFTRISSKWVHNHFN